MKLYPAVVGERKRRESYGKVTSSPFSFFLFFDNHKFPLLPWNQISVLTKWKVSKDRELMGGFLSEASTVAFHQFLLSLPPTPTPLLSFLSALSDPIPAIPISCQLKRLSHLIPGIACGSWAVWAPEGSGGLTHGLRCCDGEAGGIQSSLSTLPALPSRLAAKSLDGPKQSFTQSFTALRPLLFLRQAQGRMLVCLSLRSTKLVAGRKKTQSSCHRKLQIRAEFTFPLK